MKNLYKLSKIGFLSTILLFSSCETLDTELTDNPNFLTPDQASADLVTIVIDMSAKYLG